MTVAVSGLPTGYTYYTSPSGEEALAVSGGEAVLTVPLNGSGDTGARTVYALPDTPASSNQFTYTARVEAFSVTCGRKAPDGAANSCKISSVDGSYAYNTSLGLILNQELPEGSKIELTDQGRPALHPPGRRVHPPLLGQPHQRQRPAGNGGDQRRKLPPAGRHSRPRARPPGTAAPSPSTQSSPPPTCGTTATPWCPPSIRRRTPSATATAPPPSPWPSPRASTRIRPRPACTSRKWATGGTSLWRTAPLR